MDGPIAHTALYQEVAARLRHLIDRGELAPGAWIDEQGLARRFGISRTPLREALKVLHAEGLVRLTPRRGAVVAGELTPDDLDALFPVLGLLEGRCAYEAVRRATAAEVARLDALHAELEALAAARDADAYYERNDAFHELVQEVAANRWLSRTVGELRRYLKLLRGRQRRVRGGLAASIAEHRQFIRALHRKDAEAAERALRAQLLAQRAALGVLEPTRVPARRRGGGGSSSGGKRAGPGARRRPSAARRRLGR